MSAEDLQGADDEELSCSYTLDEGAGMIRGDIGGRKRKETKLLRKPGKMDDNERDVHAAILLIKGGE